MQITVLGSSGSIPTKERNLPSIALKHNGEIFLFDCGEGTQRQLMKFGISYAKITAIFLSHLHLDHCLGVFGILETLNLINRKKPVKIFGPPGTKKLFSKYFLAEITEINKKKNKTECKKTTAINKTTITKTANTTILEGKDYFVSTFCLKHNIPVCLGYIFKEKDKIKFHEKKAKHLGIKGPLFSEIQKKGKLKISKKTKEKIVKLKDISYIKPGRKIVYVSDTLPLKTTITASKNADLLIHDSTYLSALEKEAKENFHSTIEQAAQIAKKADVKKLLLFHISQRHKDCKEIEKEAQKVFKNSICAKDGLKITV